MHPSHREALVRAYESIRAGCLIACIEELSTTGAELKVGRPTRIGWRFEVTITGLGQPACGVHDEVELAMGEALSKLIKRTHTTAEAA